MANNYENDLADTNNGHLSFANTINGSDKPSPLIPESLSVTPPSPSAPSSPSQPQQLNEQVQPHPALAKKRRGRPIGSKNKPKPTISRELDEFPTQTFITVPAGNNIVNTIIDFGRKHDVTILVHNALGLISHVNLFNRLTPSNELSFTENMQLLSFSGLYTNGHSPSAFRNVPRFFFTVLFSRERSVQLFGGIVLDKIIAAEPVHVMAFVTKKIEYYKPLLRNTANYLSLSIEPSSSSTMNVQPLGPSTSLGLSIQSEQPHQIG